jgi:hypothetical protein
VDGNSSAERLAAAIRLEALCAEGAAQLLGASGADTSPQTGVPWRAVGWGQSFGQLLSAVVGSSDTPVVVTTTTLPQEPRLDYRFFPLVLELVRNAWKHSVSGKQVHVSVAIGERSDVLNVVVTNWTWLERIQQLKDRIATMRDGDILRGLLLVRLFADSLRDPDCGAVEWNVGVDSHAAVLAKNRDWFCMRGPAELCALPTPARLVTSAVGLRAFVRET